MAVFAPAPRAGGFQPAGIAPLGESSALKGVDAGVYCDACDFGACSAAGGADTGACGGSGHILLALAPLLGPRELRAAVPACRSWRGGLVAHLVAATGAREALVCACSQDMELIAQQLSLLAVNSAWFHPSRYTIATLVAPGRDEDALDRTFKVLDTFPAFLALPPRDVRTARSSCPCEGAWYPEATACDEELSLGEGERMMLREMSRHCGSAYVDLDGEYDEVARALYMEMTDTLRALWGVARCRGPCGGGVSVRRVAMALHVASLRAKERWLFHAVVMRVGSSDEPAGELAVAMLSYNEGRLLG